MKLVSTVRTSLVVQYTRDLAENYPPDLVQTFDINIDLVLPQTQVGNADSYTRLGDKQKRADQEGVVEVP